MAYFYDLSPYSYLASKAEENALNIGWLDEKHTFPQEEVSPKVLETLFALCLTSVNKTRGYHACPFCKQPHFGLVVEMNGKKITLGSAEIWVSRAGKTYAAPDLICHYVAEHKYLPPQEFIDACIGSK